MCVFIHTLYRKEYLFNVVRVLFMDHSYFMNLNITRKRDSDVYRYNITKCNTCSKRFTLLAEEYTTYVFIVFNDSNII